MTFKDLGLIEPILKAVTEKGYTSPTPIQEQSIPILLKKKDLLGCAQTGTGKTAAFTIPILQHLATARMHHANTVIISSFIDGIDITGAWQSVINIAYFWNSYSALRMFFLVSKQKYVR